MHTATQAPATAPRAANSAPMPTDTPAAAGLPDHTVARLGPGLRLQWEPAQNCHVILYPEGMVKLNQSAGEIMTRLDGRRDLAAVVAELEQAFELQGLRADVEAFLRMAAERGWVTLG